MIDNIDLQNTNQISFTYDLIYNGGPLVRIDINHVNEDEDMYPDIQVYPLDGCLQYRRDLINTVNINRLFRDYREEQKDL